MSQLGFNGGLAVQRAVDVRVAPQSRQASRERARLHELELKVATLEKENAFLIGAIAEAAQVYRRLSAPRLIRRFSFEIASETFAVRHVPGDFFTVIETESGLVLALGDICGKGLAAGMWTTYLVGLVNTHAVVNPDPQAIVTRINRDLCLLPAAPMVTLFMARLDPLTGRLDYCNAGHPPALLLRVGGGLEMLSEGGPLLGVLSSASFTEKTLKLSEGDEMLICSDGILESLDSDDQEFGYTRLEAQMRQARTGPADSVLFSVLGAVQDHAGARPLVDDMSLVVARRYAV